MQDELSVYFDNPATDSMGYNTVEGKLFCGRDKIELQYKQKDRAFKKNPAIVVEFDYSEVERVEFTTGWFKPRILIFKTRSPEKLEEFPGAKVGLVELHVTKPAVADAKKVATFIEYQQSEAFLEESDRRWLESRSESDPEI